MPACVHTSSGLFPAFFSLLPPADLIEMAMLEAGNKALMGTF